MLECGRRLMYCVLLKRRRCKDWGLFCLIDDLHEKNFGIFKEGAVDARDGVAFVTLRSLGGGVGDGLGRRNR